jgi:hypothetical protein
MKHDVSFNIHCAVSGDHSYLCRGKWSHITEQPTSSVIHESVA